MTQTITQTTSLEELFYEHEHLATSTLFHIFGNPHELAKSKGIEFDDIKQVAYEGLWNACSTYDETKGSAFTTHAINHIKWTLFPALTNDFNVFKYATNRIPEEEYHLSSFDEPVGLDSGSSDLHELVPNDTIEAVEDQATVELLLEDFSEKLSCRQAQIMKLKYDGWLNSEIADEVGVTRQAVGQALRTIKNVLKNQVKSFQ